MRYRGIDVSHHNGAVDWKQVKKSDVEFAMIRSGFGWDDDQQIDPQFQSNVSGCFESGIPFGFYHYSYAMSPEDALKEARWFMRVIQEYHPEYPVAFDFEEKDQLVLPPARQIEIIRTFMATMQDAGYYTLLYMPGSAISRLYHHAPEIMGAYDAWVARWGADSAGYAGSCGIWQYKVSDSGSVPGVNGKCDMNYAYRDYPRIIKSQGFNGWSQSAPEGDNPDIRQMYDSLIRDLHTLIEKYGSAF